MASSTPKLIVGLPVYNGERFLPHSIDSIINQSFDDFQLVISDNASTDRTKEISLEFARMDSRIKYHRNQTNIGGPANFNLSFSLSEGKYFKWMAHDDVIAPTFFGKCVAALEEDSSAVLAHPRTMLIDEEGKVVGEYVGRLKTGSPDVHERFHSIIAVKHSCFQMFGVVRYDAMKKTKLLTPYASSDRWFLAHLALLGRFAEVPEYLYFRRGHEGSSWGAEDRYSWNWWNPSLRSRVKFPFSRKVLEYARAIGESPLGTQERLSCYIQVAKWIAGAVGRVVVPRWQAAFVDSETLLPTKDGTTWRALST